MKFSTLCIVVSLYIWAVDLPDCWMQFKVHG